MEKGLHVMQFALRLHNYLFLEYIGAFFRERRFYGWEFSDWGDFPLGKFSVEREVSMGSFSGDICQERSFPQFKYGNPFICLVFSLDLAKENS